MPTYNTDNKTKRGQRQKTHEITNPTVSILKPPNKNEIADKAQAILNCTAVYHIIILQRAPH